MAVQLRVSRYQFWRSCWQTACPLHSCFCLTSLIKGGRHLIFIKVLRNTISTEAGHFPSHFIRKLFEMEMQDWAVYHRDDLILASLEEVTSFPLPLREKSFILKYSRIQLHASSGLYFGSAVGCSVLFIVLTTSLRQKCVCLWREGPFLPFFFFNLNFFFIKVTQVQTKRGLITNSHNLETNYPLDILAVQDTPCKNHLSDRMTQVTATYSRVEHCCASSPLKNDEEFNILIRKGIKIMLYFHAIFLIQRSQAVFLLIQLVKELFYRDVHWFQWSCSQNKCISAWTQSTGTEITLVSNLLFPRVSLNNAWYSFSILLYSYIVILILL